MKAVTVDDRRLNRVHNRNTRNPPIDLWASWIVQSMWFQNFILTVLVVNTIILGLQADLGGPSTPYAVVTVFEVIDILSLLIFVTEIVFKWIDDFVAFWTNNWNIFDFLVTAFCFVIEVVRFVSIATDSSDLAFTAQSLRSFRILRSLKLISRFKDAREITVCVTNAVKSILFISLLMFIFGYIYAIIAVTFFDYSKVSPTELDFPHAFVHLGEALKTLFQIFCNDHWIPIMKDIYLVTGSVAWSGLYVATWLVLSCYIIGNILIGIIVTSFKNRQEELRAEEEKLERRANRDQRASAFANVLEAEATKKLSVSPGKGEQPTGQTPDTDHSENAADMTTDMWTTMVEKNMVDLALEESNFCWPRDTLLRYYVLMEALQENLEERKQLLDLANHAILQMFDV